MSDVETTTQTEPMSQPKMVLQILRSGKALVPHIAEKIGIGNLAQHINKLRKEETDIDIGKYKVRDQQGKRMGSAYFIEIPGVVTEELIKSGEADPPLLYDPDEDLMERETLEAQEEPEDEDQYETTLEPEPEPEVVEADTELTEQPEPDEWQSAEDTETDPALVEEMEDEEPDEEPDRVEDEVAELADVSDETVPPGSESTMGELLQKALAEADVVADVVKEMEERAMVEQAEAILESLKAARADERLEEAQKDQRIRELEGQVEELKALAAEPAARKVEDTVRLVDDLAIRLTRDSGVVLEVVDEHGERRAYALSEKQRQFLYR